jgi:hypothetical protein
MFGVEMFGVEMFVLEVLLLIYFVMADCFVAAFHKSMLRFPQ